MTRNQLRKKRAISISTERVGTRIQCDYDDTTEKQTSNKTETKTKVTTFKAHENHSFFGN